MKKRYTLFFLIPIIFVIGCGQTNDLEIQNPKLKPKFLQNQGLADICTYDECGDYCILNSKECEDYCENHEENSYCQERFRFMYDGTNPSATRDEEKRICEGGKIKFDYAPVNMERTLVLQPLGLMTGDHVTPIDHQYFQNFNNNKADIEVYSPGDGFITNIEHMPGAKEGEDFRITIQHTCTISSLYIHIQALSENIAEFTPKKGENKFISVPIKAGEIIGYYSNNVDYNVVDEEVTLAGFVVPKHYEAEPWKIHVADTLEYFNEPVKSQLIAKSLRTAEPISGKIDYDIDGRLVGNWFLKGTNGYAGADRRGYWKGHMAIAYDALDPGRIVISIGGYDGQDSRQFGVKGNTPDPATVGVGDLIAYELVQYDFFDSEGNYWDRKSLVKGITTKNYDIIQGVALFELVEGRKLKMETFPGKAAKEVAGFTENFKVYER
jgi:hypothetical protein